MPSAIRALRYISFVSLIQTINQTKQSFDDEEADFGNDIPNAGLMVCSGKFTSDFFELFHSYGRK